MIVVIVVLRFDDLVRVIANVRVGFVVVVFFCLLSLCLTVLALLLLL